MRYLVFFIVLLSVGCSSNTPQAKEQPSKQEAVYKGKPTSAWIKQLDDKDFSTREAAIEAILALGPQAKEALPVLLKALKDSESVDEEKVVSILTVMDPEGEAVVSAMSDVLKQGNVRTPLMVREALKGYGPKAKAISPALSEALKSQNKTTRIAAALGLDVIEADTKPAIPAFIEALDLKGDNRVVVLAAEALGKIGPEAKPALPALAKAAPKANDNDMLKIWDMMKKIDPDATNDFIDRIAGGPRALIVGTWKWKSNAEKGHHTYQFTKDGKVVRKFRDSAAQMKGTYFLPDDNTIEMRFDLAGNVPVKNRLAVTEDELSLTGTEATQKYERVKDQ